MKNRSIVWFRLDLRLEDNEALTDALQASDEILPVFVFDPRITKATTRFGFSRQGWHRARFLSECVHSLRKSLRALGSDLIVRVGYPEQEIFKIADQYKTSWVFCNRERTRDEVRVQDALEKELWTIGQEMRFSRGKMLYYTQDLPFPITHTPDHFNQFRKEVERYVPIRTPLATPDSLPPLISDIDRGIIPEVEDLTLDSKYEPIRDDDFFVGGEQIGKERLEAFVEEDSIRQYSASRGAFLEKEMSSRLSPWLAHGCISPKMVYQALEQYKKRTRDESGAYSIFIELLWRDYFRLMGKKHGNSIFLLGGIRGTVRRDLQSDMKQFMHWANGTTGVPLVDACMQQLNQTGFLSGRARELVGTYLVNDMHLNWQMGASYFESRLLDYDPCSNYGNWNAIAGIGSDVRKEVTFNIASQAKILDPRGEFIKSWASKYSDMPLSEINRLHELCQN